MNQFDGIRVLRRWLLLPQAPRAIAVIRTASHLVDVPGHGRLLAHDCLDFSGETCVRSILGTKRALEQVSPGQMLEILSDNLSAVETIPFMLDDLGCEHLATIRLDGAWKLYVRRRRKQELPTEP